MNSLKPYYSYKSTRVPWLGDIPAHWDVHRLRFAAQIVAGQSPPSEIVREFTGTSPFLQGNAEFGERSPTPRLSCESPNKKAQRQDILLSVRAPVGALNIADQAYGIGRGLCAIRPREQVNRDFLYYALSTTKESLNQASTGSTYDAVAVGDVGNVVTPVPPLDEQAAIVRCLDDADQRIRAYVNAKERLIALLEEERQAIIHQAVTKGLDPNVRLKPSGVEWLGDVPEHWAVLTLGQIADSFRTGPFGSMLHQSDYVEGGIPVINPVHMRGGEIVEDPSRTVSAAVADRLSSYRLGLHDLVFSRRGELGRCALVRGRETSWLCGTGSIRVRIVYGYMEPEFLIQALQARWVGEYLSLVSVGATMANLNTAILKGVPVPVPPIQEQRDLLAFIGQRRRSVDEVIAHTRRQIELMDEYRTRLIADVVTGKIDVHEPATVVTGKIDVRRI